MTDSTSQTEEFAGSTVLETLLNAFYSGDTETVAGLLSPDVTVHQSANLPYSGDWHGVDGFFEMATIIGTNFELENLERKTVDQGEESVLFLDLKFTSRQTGKVGYTSNVEWYTFENGKIVDINVYYKDAVSIAALVEQ